MSDLTKNILIGSVVLVLVFASYKLLIKKEDQTGAGLVSTPAAVTSTSATREAATTLQKIKRIEVDTGIFSETSFVSLTDYRVEILPEAVGRDNPFAPVGF